ncbi:ABC transporter ATP-binding protein [Acholeplasma equirhinis]|uniref:ATP-binding cassette domain-containing protein n=1 Tax=Acholeplasma equirhinis TaxID=555393 RepID=UPI00197A798E|nr:ATP-binding cassette domain-containing protein [Acholeplasma equirhinis]MBN3491144.1 ABC transporter ATP-binding protein [Acholeplasma equirhinis]
MNDNVVDYSQKVLEVKNLKKYFNVGVGKNKIAIPAIDDISFDVYKREVFGLVGESGCGKTTTGRTIIKLYNPTEGRIVLDGVTIGAGYLNHVNNIKRIKEDMQNQILNLDQRKRQIVLLQDEFKEKILDLNIELDKVEKKLAADIKAANHPIDEYKEKLYTIKTQYKLDVENLQFDFILKKKDIIVQTKNSAEVEYQNELKILETNYNRKVEGLKDSAALSKETIEERLATLKSEYEQTVSELTVTYEPKIKEAAAHILDKKEAANQIKALSLDKAEKTKARKAQFEKDKLDLAQPNFGAISDTLKKLAQAASEEKARIKAEMKAVKAKLKADIQALPVEKVDASVKAERAAKIKEIKALAEEKILEEKAMISEVKHVNKSHDTLVASQRMQMIFQDPISSLNPRMTVKEIIGEGLTIQGGYSDEEITEKVATALDLVGLAPEYASRYPHEFSGGQRQRIGIARALIMNPSVIIADEPISSLDVSIRAQVINLLTELKERLGLTILFIAHDLSVVKFFCDRIAVMYYGKIVEMAPSEELFKNPMHPYTVSLLSAIPQPDPDYEKGRKRIHYNPAQHNYRNDKPSLKEISKDHFVYANDQEFKTMKEQYAKNSVNKA